MPGQPDKLAGELRGVADHLLCRHALRRGTRLDSRGLLTLHLALANVSRLEAGERDREQIVGQGDKVRLDARGDGAVGPGLLLVELVLGDIEDLLDLPSPV